MEANLLAEIMTQCKEYTEGFDLILNAIPDIVLIFDTDSRILYVNSAYCQVFGVKREKVLGKKISDIEPNALGLSVLRTGIPVRNDYSYIESVQDDHLQIRPYGH